MSNLRSISPISQIGWILLAIVLWIAALSFIHRPTVSFSDITGIYPKDLGNTRTVFWTSSLTRIPIHPSSGATRLELTIGAGRWDGRRIPQIRLAAGSQTLMTGDASTPPRHYHLLLAPHVTMLTLASDIDSPGNSDARWLGVQLFDVTATADGLPLSDALTAFWWALGGIALAVVLRVRSRIEERLLILIMLVALFLRIYALDQYPPGFEYDEAVSVVDAWYLVHTGHDHLGNPPPFGAQEAFGDWISPLLTYLELPSVALFGMQPFAGRLVTAIIGVLVIPAMYTLARQLDLSNIAALIAALVCAISPWQIFFSRYAIPPGLVPLSLTGCLIVGARFIHDGSSRQGLWLALIAGIAVYSYPTMKMLVPLLVASIVGLALVRHGWQRWRSWILPGGALASLWFPLAYQTLFNPNQGQRLNQVLLYADTPQAWLRSWLQTYSTYLLPDFWYRFGDQRIMGTLPGWGMQLWVEAPFVLLGIVVVGAILVMILGNKHHDHQLFTILPVIAPPTILWWLIAIAILLAPLPASITIPIHASRAIPLAPLYALLVGIGVATLWNLLAAIVPIIMRRGVQILTMMLIVAALLWQSGMWWHTYLNDYPPMVVRRWRFQDVAMDTMQSVKARAPEFDEVWIDNLLMRHPYIYLLATQTIPAQDTAQHLHLRELWNLKQAASVGIYRFLSFDGVPTDLPATEIILDRFSRMDVIFQIYTIDNRRILLVRGAN